MLLPLQDTPQVSNFAGRLGDSFAQVFTDFLRPLAGAASILFAGYLVAKLLQRVVERFLRRIQLNQILERGGVLEAVERGGSHPNPARAVAGCARPHARVRPTPTLTRWLRPGSAVWAEGLKPPA